MKQQMQQMSLFSFFFQPHISPQASVLRRKIKSTANVCIYINVFTVCWSCALGFWNVNKTRQLCMLPQKLQPMGAGGEEKARRRSDTNFLPTSFFSDGVSLFGNTFMFKQSSFSFMISLHHPHLQLHLLLSIYPPFAAAAVIECDVASLFCCPNQSLSLDAAAEHQKWLCHIDCSECFLIHFDKPKLAAAAATS